jgi:iron(II)-dependent oxidoreductase
MSTIKKQWRVGLIGAAGGCALAASYWGGAPFWGGAAAVAACWMALELYRRSSRRCEPSASAEAAVELAESPALAPIDPNDMDSLVEGMLARDRYALLLRRQLVSNLTAEQFQRARDALENQMALVPSGEVSLASSASDEASDDDEEVCDVRRVEAMFLDRYPITNRQYLEFVEAGGYEQMSIWDPQIWTAVFDFVDATGAPGPRFWRQGRYPRGEDELPVVGVSWYEAAAYARWVGKRLPTEAEWVKAGSWPVPLSDKKQWQRKFPWGDTMDRERCNLWGSGPGKVVAVGEFSSGVSVGGVYQLIGNVWEWTSGNFGATESASQDLLLPVPMKSIRGGAFDTYFENQATCQFQSGENPLSRKHNIGFRCALGMCDVAAPQPEVGAEGPAESPAAEAESLEETHV